MTFSVELLCDRAAIDSGAITRVQLFDILTSAFHVSKDGPFIVSTFPELAGDLARNSMDTDAEVAAAFDGLVRLDLGGCWGTGWREDLRFEEALEIYVIGLAKLAPGSLAGYWRSLAGPGADPEAPRFERIVLPRVDDLLHRGYRDTNQVVLVVCRVEN
jgi:hypothetical protein